MKLLIKYLMKCLLGVAIHMSPPRFLLWAGHLLPPQILRWVISVSPHRFLYKFDHSKLRDKFFCETDPIPYGLWGIFSGEEGHMCIQGWDCVNLAKDYGTPLFVVNKKKLEKNYVDFYDSFHKWYPRIEVYYSYKTNPIPGVIWVLHKLGAGAEVVSPNELRLALSLGVPPRKIIYNGPGKTKEGLSIAVSNNIKLINIDGHHEIEMIDNFAQKNGHQQQVGVRIETAVGWKTKFGFSIKNGHAFRAYENIMRLNNLIPCALQFHLGTNITNFNVYLQAIEQALDFTLLLKKELGITLKYFDFGGGFYVPTVKYYSALDHKLLAGKFPAQKTNLRNPPPLSEYGRAITKLFCQYFPADADLSDPPTIILEPGRAITSDAQSLLLKVLDIKPPADGITNVILDGGNYFAQPVKDENHEVIYASNLKAPPDRYYRLFGPSCMPGDILFFVKRLPYLKRNDFLAIMDAGAYFTSLQSNFCFFPHPAAVIIDNSKYKLIRQRQSFDDLIAQDFPDKYR